MQFSPQHVSLIQGAISIEAMGRCSEGFSTVTIDHMTAHALHRLVTDADYRESCLTLHGELFTASDSPDKLQAIIHEVNEWLKQHNHNTLPSASPTADTVHTSRAGPTTL